MSKRTANVTMEQGPTGNVQLRGPGRKRGNRKPRAGPTVGSISRLKGRWHWRIPHPYSQALMGSSDDLKTAIQAAYAALEVTEAARERCAQAGGARSVHSTPMGGQPSRK